VGIGRIRCCLAPAAAPSETGRDKKTKKRRVRDRPGKGTNADGHHRGGGKGAQWPGPGRREGQTTRNLQ